MRYSVSCQFGLISVSKHLPCYGIFHEGREGKRYRKLMVGGGGGREGRILRGREGAREREVSE